MGDNKHKIYRCSAIKFVIKLVLTIWAANALENSLFIA